MMKTSPLATLALPLSLTPSCISASLQWSKKMAHCNMGFEDLFDLDPFLTNLWNISVVHKPTSTAGPKEKQRFGGNMPFKTIPGATYCGCDCNERCSWKRADYLAGPGNASPAAGPGEPGQGTGRRVAAKAKKKQRTLVTWGCTHCPPEARVANDLAALHHEMCVEHLAMYRPSRSVRSSLAALDVDWDRVVGVHVRQGDKTKSTNRAVKSECKTTATTDIFAASIKQLLARDKNITTFYVASDNPKAVLALTQQFPRGMVLSANDVLHGGKRKECTHPIGLDLWALASSKIILGSPGSTFGYLAAALGNPTPLVYPEQCTGNLTHPHFPDDVDLDPITHMDRLSDYSHRVFCTAGGSTDKPCKKV